VTGQDGFASSQEAVDGVQDVAGGVAAGMVPLRKRRVFPLVAAVAEYAHGALGCDLDHSVRTDYAGLTAAAGVYAGREKAGDAVGPLDVRESTGLHARGVLVFAVALVAEAVVGEQALLLGEDRRTEGQGQEVTDEQLADIMLYLQNEGCHNINFVTPTHVVPQILEALVIAVDQGLNVPLVYNSGGYDRRKTLKLLDGIFDIYMPDFKFWDNRWAKRYCRTPDYRETAVRAVKEMYRQVGDLEMDDAGIAVRGLLVRHLMLPGHFDCCTRPVLEWLAQHVPRAVQVSLKSDYIPMARARQDRRLNRFIDPEEERRARAFAAEVELDLLPTAAPSPAFPTEPETAGVGEEDATTTDLILSPDGRVFLRRPTSGLVQAVQAAGKPHHAVPKERTQP